MYKTVRPRLLRSSNGRRGIVENEERRSNKTMASGDPTSPLYFNKNDAHSPSGDSDNEISSVSQVATQTQLLDGDIDTEVDDIHKVTTSPTHCVVVNDSLTSSPASSTDSTTDHQTTAAQTQQYIAVTEADRSYASLTTVNPAVVSAEQAGGVVVTGDAVAHSAYVHYVDDTSAETATIYTTTNGQMAYPVYTMGEATATTMYTPAATGQYYTPANQSTVTYSQGQGQIITQAPGTATYILQQGVDGTEGHALITNRASPPTVSAEAVAAAVGYMVQPTANQTLSQNATAVSTTTTITNNSSAPSPLLDEASDQGNSSHSNISHATRVSPATVQWLIENYETADGVSLPRSTLYNHYLRHCNEQKLDPVNAASFGKLIRSVFIGLRTRRLGTRGNSKYHYYGIRIKPSSNLSPVDEPESCSPNSVRQQSVGINNTAVQPNTTSSTTNKRYKTGQNNKNDFDGHTGQNNINNSNSQTVQHQQYLGESSSAVPPFPEIDFTGINLPNDCTYEDVDTLRSIYREHCEAFVDAVTALEFTTVESLWREFWRSSDNNNGDECEEEKYLSKTKLYALCKCEPVQQFVRKVDFDFYQNMVEVLIPDVLRPIPSALTQAIRNFAKGLEGWLTSAMAGCPETIMNIKLCAVSAFAQTLRRYTSLNHLAQAARAVLQNSTQINQMLADLNRVDFHNVQEQASWVCQCDSELVQRLEADFKATLQQQNSLEQWAQWLKNVVATVLKPYEGKSNFSKAARQFLLKWSFYSSMVIRDLTLRSAASFGSFHLIRLLYDEYMFYLIEHQVAQATGETPIAVIGERTNTAIEISDDMYDLSSDRNNVSLQALNIYGIHVNGSTTDDNDPTTTTTTVLIQNNSGQNGREHTGPTLRSDSAKRLKMS